MSKTIKKKKTKLAAENVDIDALLAKEKIIDGDVGEEIENSMLSYAVLTILDRALPDARDGLKPVQRRILYGALAGGFTSNKHKFFKNARIVGDVMGKLHPHGDQAIYEALTKLSQPWYERYPLFDFQGNMGSMDGDSSAAMRYTEGRLLHFSEDLMLEDVGKKRCVDFHPTYADDDTEPDVLPSLLPNLLVNGSYGIAVAYTTDIPGHNVVDAANAVTAVLDNPDITAAELGKVIQAPDLPVPTLLLRDKGIDDLYAMGSGRLTFRAPHELEEDSNGCQLIVFTGLPPWVDKVKLQEVIGGLIRDRALPRVLGVRDESRGMDVRLVVVCQKTARVPDVLHDLFAKTDLQSAHTYTVNAVVGTKPEQLNLRRIIDVYLDHRRGVVTRRTKGELGDAQHKLHMLEALHAVTVDPKRAATIISDAEDDAAAVAVLKQTFGLDDEQADYVLELKLRRLTKLNRKKIEDDISAMQAEIDRLNSVLVNIDDEIRRQLKEMTDKYGDARRTVVVDSFEDFSIDGGVDEHGDVDNVVCVTTANKTRDFAPEEFSTLLDRGGLRDRGQLLRLVTRCAPGEELLLVFADGTCSRVPARMFTYTHEQVDGLVALVRLKAEAQRTLLLVLANGHMRKIPVAKLRVPDKKRTVLARDATEECPLVQVLPVDDDPADVVCVVTAQGYVGRFSLNSFTESGMTSRCLPTCALADGDHVAEVIVTRRGDDQAQRLVLFGVDASGKGLCKAVDLAEVTVKGRTARALPYVKGKAFAGTRRAFIAPVDGEVPVLDEKHGVHTLLVGKVPVLKREAIMAPCPLAVSECVVPNVAEALTWRTTSQP